MWHVAQVLSDAAAMPGRVLVLSVPVAPEHVRQRLTNRCACPHRMREHGRGISDVEDHTTGVPPLEGGASTPGNSSAEVQQALGSPQLHRYQPSIRNRDPSHAGQLGVASQPPSSTARAWMNSGTEDVPGPATPDLS